MVHRFQCRCGRLQGEIAQTEQAMRAVCYCRDCQAYAHLLGEPQQVLDAHGGTDIVATQSRYVRFTSGAESLACLSLSPRGLLRWYAGCCRTAIANTPRDWKLPYVGMVHSCPGQPQAMEASFPRIHMAVNTKSAQGAPPAVSNVRGLPRFARLMLRLLAARARGSYRQTPFFDANGAPVVEVKVAQREAVARARSAVGA
jgi:hypothetical protein